MLYRRSCTYIICMYIYVWDTLTHICFSSLSLYVYIYICIYNYIYTVYKSYKTVYLYISAHVGVYIRTYQTLRYITFHSIAFHYIHTQTYIYIYHIYTSGFYHAKTQAISLFIHLTHDTCVLEETCPKNLDWELLKELDTFKHFLSVLWFSGYTWWFGMVVWKSKSEVSWKFWAVFVLVLPFATDH